MTWDLQVMPLNGDFQGHSRVQRETFHEPRYLDSQVNHFVVAPVDGTGIPSGT
jgi:hypothetical protein